MSRASGHGGAAAAAATAVPLIQCDSAGRFHLQPAAARLLSGIKGRICPVVVCGPYRTGKSTLLNLLLDTNVKSAGGASFAVGGTVQASVTHAQPAARSSCPLLLSVSCLEKMKEFFSLLTADAT